MAARSLQETSCRNHYIFEMYIFSHFHKIIIFIEVLSEVRITINYKNSCFSVKGILYILYREESDTRALLCAIQCRQSFTFLHMYNITFTIIKNMLKLPNFRMC